MEAFFIVFDRLGKGKEGTGKKGEKHDSSRVTQIFFRL
jgi:hypothetical protein